jgi:hypothetical protein
MDDEHVLAFVEAVHGTDFHAIHVFALDAVFGDDVGHFLGAGALRKRDYLIGAGTRPDSAGPRPAQVRAEKA